MPPGEAPPNGEREAIERLRRGEIGGLEMLVGRYQLAATRAAYLVLRDRQLAEDIVCDAFLRCSERIQQFDPERPFGPWCLRAVVNGALKAAHRRSRDRSLDSPRAADGPALSELLAEPESGPDAQAERAEIRAAIKDALERLTPRQRAAIVLHYYLGLTGPEIADELSTPLGTVKRHLHEARSRLRGLLAGVGTPGPRRTTAAARKAAPVEEGEALR